MEAPDRRPRGHSEWPHCCPQAELFTSSCEGHEAFTDIGSCHLFLTRRLRSPARITTSGSQRMHDSRSDAQHYFFLTGASELGSSCIQRGGDSVGRDLLILTIALHQSGACTVQDQPPSHLTRLYPPQSHLTKTPDLFDLPSLFSSGH